MPSEKNKTRAACEQCVRAVLATIFAVFATATSAQGDQTTGNLIYSVVNPAPTGATFQWNGFTVTNSTGGGLSGGNVPGYNTSTNTFMFGYTPSTVAYTMAINSALSGTGIQISGYNYSWQYYNFDYYRGSLTGQIRLTSPTGSILQSYNYSMPVQGNQWYTQSGTQNFGQLYGLASVGNLQVSFTGQDDRFWAGYYGPQIRNINVSLNYSVDPCATNPAYSPSCPGYNDIITSGNLVPYPNHWTINGATINNSYAINQALGLAGSQVRIHGFDYGYQYNLGSSYTQCTAFNQDGSCSWTMSFNPQVAVNFSVKNSAGSTIYSQNHTHTGSNTGNQSRSYQYRFGTSQDLLNLGTIGFTGTTSGNSTLFGMYNQAVYTNDSCASDPLISPTCPGYAAAYLTQQCTANPLYDQSCPGYAQAYFTQQCTANQLYNPACPGYAAAYLTYQCNIDQLYSPSCPGYAQAYFDQQCSLNPLYNNQCPGYADAYYVQQCTANPLYDTGCTGYAQAYFDQQCAADGLYDRSCPNYATAYAIRNLLNPVSSSPVTVAETTTTTTALVSDPVVNNMISVTATSANPADAATATVPLISAPSTATTTAATSDPKEDTKPTATTERTATTSSSSDKKDQPQTARQALAERRLEAARAKAVEEGKNLAGRMGEAATMEAQAAVQNVVILAMGFTPGFDAYGRVTLPDAQGYQSREIYQGQRNVDNPAGRRFLTGSDSLHAEMVDQQWGGSTR